MAQIGAAQLGARRLGEVHRPPRRPHRRGVGRLHDRLRLPPVPRGGHLLARRHLRGRLLGGPRPPGHPRRAPARGGDGGRRRGSRVDFDGTDTRPELQSWSTFGNTRGYTVAQIAAMMDPEIPHNEGFFEAIELQRPRGCLLNPEPGQPVSAGTHHPGAEVAEVIALALQDVLPERAVPQVYKTGMPTVIVGTDPRTGQSVHRPLRRGVRGMVQRGQGHGRLGLPGGQLRQPVEGDRGDQRVALPAHPVEPRLPHRLRRTGPVAGAVRQPLRQGGAGRRRGLHLRGRHEVPHAGHRRRPARRTRTAW